MRQSDFRRSPIACEQRGQPDGNLLAGECAPDGYDPSEYGNSCAAYYDELYGRADRKTVAVLAALAGEGNCLELGLATGRTALELLCLGVKIMGVEASRAMIDQFLSKAGASRIPVYHTNFARFVIEARFSLIFALQSTFYLLPTREAQLQCLRTARRHLTLDGCLLIEATVRGCRNACEQRSGRVLESITATTKPVEYLIQTSSGPQSYRVRLNCAEPEELDKLAGEAGMRLRERWDRWDKRPFSVESAHSISVYDQGRGS